MAKITYANKVALNENPEIADINKVKDTDMNQIKEVVNANEAKVLLEVSNIAPDTCSTGDMYFNTTTNLIYTATATNTWGSTGVAPTSNTMYVTFSDKTIYMYNGTTLIKISSGIGDNEPIGKVVPMVLETAPDGYLLCDGSIYTKTQYSDLYKALRNTVYQLDDEEFQVPNIQGKVIVGKKASDTDFAFIGRDGGSKELQEHSHQIKGFRNTINGTGETIPVASFRNVDDDADGAYTRTTGTGNSGNLQPYTVLNYFIKAQKLSGDVVLSESLPVGTEVDFDGEASDIPVGWEEVSGKSQVAYTLYDNDPGTTGTVTLNDNISNYEYIEIYSQWYTDYTLPCVKLAVGKITNNKFNISWNTIDNTNQVIFQKTYNISGSSITKDSMMNYIINTGTKDTYDVLRITKVIGYKEV